jgi:response regulator RpfG family c-di-GMP phosphodiesterase
MSRSADRPAPPTAAPSDDYSAYPILYVDDEPANLVTFRFSLEDEFRIITAGSGEAALEVLSSEPVAVLVTDHRMDPGISGTELCARARATRPEAVRMILTAHGDLDAALQAINDGHVRRFIAKPWESADMVAILREAIEAFRRQSSPPAAEGESLRRELIRRMADPATALRHNLEWSEEALTALEPALKGGARKVSETYRKLRSAVTDSKDAASDLCDALDELSDDS